MAKSVMEQLVKDGRVRRGMLGVNIQNITDEIGKNLDLKDVKGVIVTNVRAGSAADKGGVKRRDIITAINGDRIDDGNVLRNKVASTLPGTEITLSVLRDGQPLELRVTLDEFSSLNGTGEGPDGPANPDAPAKPSGKLGLELQPLTPDTARKLKIPEDVTGLLVTSVDPGGSAAAEGVQRGDVIAEVNSQMVGSVDDMKTALEKSGDRPVLLLIVRNGNFSYITVKPKQ
jgi:S1-C subfamily serine protease